MRNFISLLTLLPQFQWLAILGVGVQLPKGAVK